MNYIRYTIVLFRAWVRVSCFTALSRRTCAKSAGVISSAFCLLMLRWKSWVIRLTACLHCVTHEVTGGSRYVSVCKRLLRLLLGPLRSLTSHERLRLTAQSRYIADPQPFSFSFLFPFSLLLLSSTSFVFLCFTLCLHRALWVVPS